MTFATYSNTGPWTNNALPSISATFLNNIESFLDQIVSNLVADSNIGSDGAGNITSLGNITFTSGKAKVFSSSGVWIVDASGGTDLLLNAPNAGGNHKCVLLVGGVRVLSVNSAGATTIKGTLTQNGAP